MAEKKSFDVVDKTAIKCYFLLMKYLSHPFTVDAALRDKLRLFNSVLERGSGLKIGVSYIIRVAIKELLEKEEAAKIIMDSKAKE